MDKRKIINKSKSSLSGLVNNLAGRAVSGLMNRFGRPVKQTKPTLYKMEKTHQIIK